MRYLYTLDELLAITTNGWSCPACGKAWLDTVPGVAFPYVPSADQSCRHPLLKRATISREQVPA
jgi:hypothetical protein